MIFFLKIDNITQDTDLNPDPNEAKILDSDQNECIWIHNTAWNQCGGWILTNFNPDRGATFC